MKLFRYRAPSINTILGATKAKQASSQARARDLAGAALVAVPPAFLGLERKSR